MQLAVVTCIHPRYHGEHPSSEGYLLYKAFDTVDAASAEANRRAHLWSQVRPRPPHPGWPTFWRHASSPDVEIVTVRTGVDGAAYATLHTHVIRTLQRRWRSLLRERRARLSELSSPRALVHQQRTGGVMPTRLNISEWWKDRCSWMR
jgi:hypothetical protein